MKIFEVAENLKARTHGHVWSILWYLN